MNVVKICKACICLLVPSEHRVDRFRELGTTGFVDAASVNPAVLEAIVLSSFATADKLRKPFLRWRYIRQNILQSNLLRAPSMREDNVIWHFALQELFHL